MVKSLQVLLKFGLVKYKPASFNDTVPEFSLQPSHVLFLLRYPRFVHLIKNKFNETYASLITEILMEGIERASTVIAKTAISLETITSDDIQELRSAFADLVNHKFIIRAATPIVPCASVPILEIEATKMFFLPEISIKNILEIVAGNKNKAEDNNVFWTINVERMHQELRDNIMITAIERRIDSKAGECLKQILKCIYSKTEPWKAISAPVCMGEIRRCCEKSNLSDSTLLNNIEDYISMINVDTLEIISKVGELDGGQFTVNFRKAFIEFTWNCVEQAVGQRFGLKAARIFRVVRLKKYIEQENIQKEAMIPAKEAKLLTYKLLEENFLQVHPIRKAGGGGSGPAKAFYLFHIKISDVVSMLLDHSYKALYNTLKRTEFTMEINKRLIDKNQYYESVIEDLREKGGPEVEKQIEDLMEQVTPPEREILQKVKIRLKALSTAEIIIDEMIFLLQMHQYYSNLP